MTPPFKTRPELLAWLEVNGIGHVASLNFQALEPFVPVPIRLDLKSLGAKKRLVDLASLDEIHRSLSWLAPSGVREIFLSAVTRFIEAEREGAIAARHRFAARADKVPSSPNALALFNGLMALRSKFPASVAPREEPPVKLLKVEPAMPGFVLHEPLPTLLKHAGFGKPEVRLGVAPFAVVCTCGAATCVHALAAIDAALEWCRQPSSEQLEATVAQLARPAWERTLERLDQALDEPEAAEAALKGKLPVLWGLRVIEGMGVEVVGLVQTQGKRGAWFEAPRRHLLELHAGKLTELDERIAALLPDSRATGVASKGLLEALVDCPRVVLLEEPERSAKIEKVTVGLVAEERQGSVYVRAGIDGSALPDALRERVRVARPHEPLFLWDGGARRLTLLEVKPELRVVLQVLHQNAEVFPPESLPSLLASLSKWAQHLPVSMPRSVLGESVPVTRSMVLRLQAEAGGSVVLEVRVRPLLDGPALVPGHGGRDVHLRRGETPVHGLRDLVAEKLDAEALCAELPLARAEPLHLPFQFRFDSAHGALDVLEAVSHHSPPVELEWIGKPLRVLSARGPGSLRVKLEQRREWFGLLGDLSVSGERVELAVALDAVRRKERYVRVDAQTYLELSQALRAQLEGLADHVHASPKGLEVGPSALHSLSALERAGAEMTAAAPWRALEARMAAAQKLVPEVPKTLQAELRGYQLDGFRWLITLAAWGAGGVLADDMGLGKTLQALTVLLHRSALGPAVVVAPTSVAFNWVEEAKRFAPSLRLHVYADQVDRQRCLGTLGPGDVVVISYGLLVGDIAALSRLSFATAVFDEAQALKNAKTQRARAARQLRADFKCALSGTPLENHLGELWSLFSIVFPSLLGTWEAFRVRYALPIEKHIDPAAAPALAKVMTPFLLRRTKAQVETQLPPRTEVRVPVVLSPPEWQLYEDTRLAALADLETPRQQMREQERRIEVLAALTRLRLIASHPRLHDPTSKLTSSKLERLLELIDELRAEGHRALVFSQFTTHLALVREALDARGIPSVYLDGSTPRQARQDRVHEFQRGDAPLFLISLKAGGVGLNLTAASTVIHLDPWWNPAVEDQASDRAHRLGQTKPVTIFRLVAMGTIEEQMLSLHSAKRSLIARVLEGTDQAASLSSDALLALLRSTPHRPG